MQIQAVHELRKLALTGQSVANNEDDHFEKYKTSMPPTRPDVFNGSKEALIELSFKTSTDKYESLRFDFTKFAENMYGIMSTMYSQLTADINYLSSQLSALQKKSRDDDAFLSGKINALSSKLSADNHALSTDYITRDSSLDGSIAAVSQRLTDSCKALSSDGYMGGIYGYRFFNNSLSSDYIARDAVLNARIDGLTSTYDNRYLMLSKSAKQIVYGPVEYQNHVLTGTITGAQYATSAGSATYAATADTATHAKWS